MRYLLWGALVIWINLIPSQAQAAIAFRSASSADTDAGQPTRFYMQNAAPGATIATHRGAWDNTGSVLQRGLSRTKAGAIASLGVAETSTTNNFDVLILKLVSEPLTFDQTISGTLNWIQGVQESANQMNAHWHVHAYVTDGNTDTLVGTLLTNYTEAAGTNEWPTTGTGDAPNATQTLTAVTATAGDRIVIETGYVARNTENTSRTGTMWYGGTGGTDLAAGGNETTNPGWWEFSQGIFNPLTINVPAGTVANDVMIAGITVRPCSNTDGGACTLNVSAPNGWTLLNTLNQTEGAGTDGYGNRLLIYYRVATAAEPASYNWIFGGFPEHAGAIGGILSFSGVDTTSPIVASGSQLVDYSYTQTAPEINTGTVTNTMLVSIHSINSSGSWTPPGGMTERVDAASLALTNTLGLSLEMNNELRAAAGLTGTRIATLSNPPANDTGANFMLALRPSAVDHFDISVGANALTCSPQSITITAKDSSNATITNYTGTINITTPTANHGDWSQSPVSGTLVNGTADDGAASYTFVAGDNGVKNLLLSNTHAETLVVRVVDSTVATSSSDSGNLTFAHAGFRIVSASLTPLTITTKIAGKDSATVTEGQNLFLQAVRTDLTTFACTNLFPNNTSVSVGMAFECIDPVNCIGGQNATVTNYAGAPVTTSNVAMVNTVGTYTNVPLHFGNNSMAQFRFNYPDVGAIILHTRYVLSPSNEVMTGSSNQFVVKPAGFTITNIVSGVTNNPAAADATGNVFIPAGQAFAVRVTAVANDGTTATPNFGNESTPEGVLLSHTLFAPAGGANGTFSNGTVPGTEFGSTGMVSDADGLATVNNLSWDEVGIIRLSGQIADNDYLGAGTAPSTFNSVNIGRFRPAHFALSAGALTNRAGAGCGSNPIFTYLGENLQLGFTLAARNTGSVITTNYRGAFVKLDPTATASLNIGAIDSVAPTPLSGRIPIPPAISSNGAWGTPGNGQVNILATVSINRGATPEAPLTSVRWGVAPQDSDNVVLNTLNLDINNDSTNDRGLVTTGVLRYGRLYMENAFGSEILPLAIPLRAEYATSATLFALNTDDTCTTYNSTNISYANRNGLTVDPTASGSGTLVNGRYNTASPILLSAPGVGVTGSIDAILNVPAYLHYDWDNDTNYDDDDPRSKATFGIYGGPEDNQIYIREVY